MRTSFLLLFAIGLCLCTAASAQIRFLPYIGYSFTQGIDLDGEVDGDSGDFPTTGGLIIGVGAEVSLTPAILPVGIKLRPSVETSFLSGASEDVGGIKVSADQSTFRGELDVIAEFSPPAAPLGLFAGAGLAYMTYTVDATVSDGDESESDSESANGFGVALLGGARFGGGFAAPFVQARYTLGGPSNDEAFGEELGNALSGAFAILVGLSIGL